MQITAMSWVLSAVFFQHFALFARTTYMYYALATFQRTRGEEGVRAAAVVAICAAHTLDDF